MNDFMLIQRMEKGNLGPLTFLISFFHPIHQPERLVLQLFGLLLPNFGINKGSYRENRS